MSYKHYLWQGYDRGTMMNEEILNIDVPELGLRMKYAGEVENRRWKAEEEPETTQADMAKAFR